MKVIWLGQAGLLFETENKIIMVDPYLSDSVEKIEPQNKRRVPVDKSFFDIKPDIIVLTHNHLDHTDPDTLKHFVTQSSNMLVLASGNAWSTVRSTFGGNNNYVMFNRCSEWIEGNIKFTAVKAEHSDENAIGFIMEAEGKKYYVT
ncbi:MAG: MBL fold metallo-hydrolase, partial [Clostridiales bacterium]|nr:MBL fold metallo-hydrolase [Clostridiales bacterium]